MSCRVRDEEVKEGRTTQHVTQVNANTVPIQSSVARPLKKLLILLMNFSFVVSGSVVVDLGGAPRAGLALMYTEAIHMTGTERGRLI